MCPHPYMLRNEFGELKSFPCNWCTTCRIDRREAWSDRIKQEMIATGGQSTFCTLTFRNEFNVDKSLHKSDIQKFMKRMRQISLRKSFNKTFKYYAVGEYGGKFGRKHYHIIFIGLDPKTCRKMCSLAWKFGFFQCKTANPTNVRYTLSYLDKSRIDDNKTYKAKGLEAPFGICSKHIGHSFFMAHLFDFARIGGYYVHGKRRPLPRYYRDLLKNSKYLSFTGLSYNPSEDSEFNWFDHKKNLDYMVHKTQSKSLREYYDRLFLFREKNAVINSHLHSKPANYGIMQFFQPRRSALSSIPFDKLVANIGSSGECHLKATERDSSNNYYIF